LDGGLIAPVGGTEDGAVTSYTLTPLGEMMLGKEMREAR
jgi:hypothetical protein